MADNKSAGGGMASRGSSNSPAAQRTLVARVIVDKVYPRSLNTPDEPVTWRGLLELMSEVEVELRDRK